MLRRAAPREPIPHPGPLAVARAIKLTYAQMMLTAIFGASTGGMFLVGFAIELGADDILLGAMVSIPQFFVIFQFVAAYFVERGVSRKKITTVFAFLSPSSWFLIAAMAFFAGVLTKGQRVAVLIGIIVLVTISAHMMSNARASWIGELVPAERRGRFFGYCTLFAGIVGSVFAIIEGRFLDVIRSYGLFAFSGLFLFGAVFGLASAALHMPQPDCPLPGEGRKPPFWELARDTLRNRPFVLLALVHAVLALSGIVGPFFAAYCLRDVGMSFFGLGIVNSVLTAAALLSSPFLGKLVDRVGCRPVLILSLLLMAPTAVVWLFIPPKSVFMAYLLLPLAHVIVGLASGGVGVALASLMYKMSKPEGRSVQFAAYSVFVAMASAPMPLLGGWLVSRLQSAGYSIDLRLTFYLSSAFVFLSALVAMFLREPGSVPVRTLVREHIPAGVAGLWQRIVSVRPFASRAVRAGTISRKDADDPESERKP